MTKAPVKAPPSRRMNFVSGLSQMPTIEAPDNIQEKKLVDLGFKVKPDLRQRFRMAAAMHDKSMREILEEAFALWTREAEGK